MPPETPDTTMVFTSLSSGTAGPFGSAIREHFWGAEAALTNLFLTSSVEAVPPDPGRLDE